MVGGKSSDDDLFPENVHGPIDDKLGHGPVLEQAKNILIQPSDSDNLAIFGRWGSGKSTLLRRLQLQLEKEGNVKVVWYDAWKFRGEDLHRHFLSVAASQLISSKEERQEYLHGPSVKTTTYRLLGATFWKYLAWTVLVAVSLGVGAFFFVENFLTGPNAGNATSVDERQLLFHTGWMRFLTTIVAALIVYLAVQGSRATVEHTTPSGADQFDKRFSEILERARLPRSGQVVFIIDELDRCEPAHMIGTLESLRTVMDSRTAKFVTAIDPQALETAVREVHPVVPKRSGPGYYRRPAAFIDKVFQHQLELPKPRLARMTWFADEKVRNAGGVWAEVRALGNDFLEELLHVLVPAHVDSPRRAIQLLNAFVVEVRLAKSRVTEWRDHALSIAKLVVLRREFPTFYDDLYVLRRLPSLVGYEIVAEKPEEEVDPDGRLGWPQELAFLRDKWVFLREVGRTPWDVARPEWLASAQLLVALESDEDLRNAWTYYHNLRRYLRDTSMVEDPPRVLLFQESHPLVAIEGHEETALRIEDEALEQPVGAMVSIVLLDNPEAEAVALDSLNRCCRYQYGPDKQSIVESILRAVPFVFGDLPRHERKDMGDASKETRVAELSRIVALIMSQDKDGIDDAKPGRPHLLTPSFDAASSNQALVDALLETCGEQWPRMTTRLSDRDRTTCELGMSLLATLATPDVAVHALANLADTINEVRPASMALMLQALPNARKGQDGLIRQAQSLVATESQFILEHALSSSTPERHAALCRLIFSEDFLSDWLEENEEYDGIEDLMAAVDASTRGRILHSLVEADTPGAVEFVEAMLLGEADV